MSLPTIGGHDADTKRAKLDELHSLYAPQVLGLIVNLKGLYIKLGQVMSVRPDLVPQRYRKELRTLQSDVPARPVEEVIGIIESELGYVHSMTWVRCCYQ